MATLSGCHVLWWITVWFIIMSNNMVISYGLNLLAFLLEWMRKLRKLIRNIILAIARYKSNIWVWSEKYKTVQKCFNHLELLLKFRKSITYLLKILSSGLSLLLRFITLKQFKMLSGVVQVFKILTRVLVLKKPLKLMFRHRLFKSF